MNMFCHNMNMVDINKLPQTENEWLDFISKLKRESNKLRKQYGKYTREYWLKKVKGIKPDYFAYNGSPFNNEPFPVKNKPEQEKSYLAIYHKEDFELQEQFTGIEELDKRDRGFRYEININNLRIRYNQFCLFEIFKIISIDEVEVSLHIIDERFFGISIAFTIDLGTSCIRGDFNNYSCNVRWINCPLSANPVGLVESKELLNKQSSNPKVPKITKWALKIIKEAEKEAKLDKSKDTPVKRNKDKTKK